MDSIEKKQMVKNTFNTVAGGYDGDALRFFTRAAGLLHEHFGLEGSEHVLDVATGTGNAALALLPHLPTGRITAIDFSEGMLSIARTRLGEASNVELKHMDIEAIEYPDAHFDAAVSSFGIFFVDDMAAQLGHMLDKVKPGGRVLFTTFHESTFSPLTELLYNCLGRYGVTVDPKSTRRLTTESECSALARAAGAAQCAMARRDVGYFLKDASEWWEIVYNAGFRRFVEQVEPDRREAFRQEHLAEVASTAGDEGIWLDVKVIYTLCIKEA